MRKFILLVLALGAAAASTPAASRGLAGDEDPAIPTRVVSTSPPLRWEDAMISGNGSTGIMVMGLPLEDRIIVNHEKFWVVGNDFRPQTPDLRQAWKEARAIAREGRYLDADRHIVEKVGEINRRLYGESFRGSRPRYDRTHPGFHMLVSTGSSGRPLNYRREMNLETGEISVSWTDNRGDWVRRIFVSRTDDVIVMELSSPAGSTIDAFVRLMEAPGKLAGDMEAVKIDHRDDEMYLHATYGRRMGKTTAEGYHALARIVLDGGASRAVENERIEIAGARKALIVMRIEYLDKAVEGDRAALRRRISGLPGDYAELLEPHAAVHGEMFHRVTLNLGGRPETVPSTEALIAEALKGESMAEFFELMYAVGRYAMICAGTGEIAPTLMGLWGNEWDPPWDGRFTFDANLNLAISSVSQGNLPEAMETYAGFLERNLDDWRNNAMMLYGCRGAVTDLCQGWRHGAVLMATYPWTGGVGWLAAYLYDHYLFTQDRVFLKERALPMLRLAADFYADFLTQYPELNGRYVIYPSISPENVPIMTPADQGTNVVPNSTGEIAICREVFSNLIDGCRELGLQEDSIPKWEAILTKLPDYVINEDGALAEWAFPGLGDRYNHRHSSHLYPVWPGLEISPDRAPELFAAARTALEKRLETGLGNNSAHGIMHVSLVAARLKDPDLMWRMLTTFARQPFLNASFITCHNIGPRIYNLDATFSMPTVLMEMLVYSEPGLIELLPSLPRMRFPRGRLNGLLARGGIMVEELNWNNTLGSVNVILRSQREQTIKLRFGIYLRYVNTEDPAEAERVSGSQREGWAIRLPAGNSLSLRCRY